MRRKNKTNYKNICYLKLFLSGGGKIWDILILRSRYDDAISSKYYWNSIVEHTFICRYKRGAEMRLIINLNVIKHLLIVFSLILSVNSLYAAKVKSSKSYLKKVDVELTKFRDSFNGLKSTLNQGNKTNSFLSSDFWGIEHHLYVENYLGEITNSYPFSSKWLQPWGSYEKYSSAYVRNIKGVVLTPTASKYNGRSKNGKSWFHELRVSFDLYPGYRSSNAYHDYIQQYFVSNGIPASKIDSAFSYFENLVDPLTNLLIDKAYKKMDKIYSNSVNFGDVSILEKIASKLDQQGKLNLDNFYTPSKHNAIYKQLMSTDDGVDIQKSLNSYKQFYSNYEDRYSSMDLWKFYQNIEFRIRIEGHTQWFNVAQGMSKTKKYNHLLKLKEILDKKVSSKKVIRKTEKAYTVYEDNSRYNKGRLAINFKNGEGFWQDPWVSNDFMIKYEIDKINTSVEKVNIAIKNYLAICLDETVKKFKNTTTITDDF